MTNIGEKLRNYFDSQGISQIDIAKRLGVSKTYINALLAENRRFVEARPKARPKLFS